jgi:hypothetical protein
MLGFPAYLYILLTAMNICYSLTCLSLRTTGFDILSADETCLFLSLQPTKTFAFRGDFSSGVIKSKQQVTAFLECNADSSNKLTPLVSGKYKSPRCFKNVKRLSTKYEGNTNPWLTTKIFVDYLTQMDTKLDGKNCKILLFIYQCTDHLKNTTFLSNIKIVFLPANCTRWLESLDLGIIHAFKCQYKKQPWDGAQMKLDVFYEVWFLNWSCKQQWLQCS